MLNIGLTCFGLGLEIFGLLSIHLGLFLGCLRILLLLGLLGLLCLLGLNFSTFRFVDKLCRHKLGSGVKSVSKSIVKEDVYKNQPRNENQNAEKRDLGLPRVVIKTDVEKDVRYRGAEKRIKLLRDSRGNQRAQ